MVNSYLVSRQWMVSYSGRFILWSTTSLVRTRKLVCEVGKDEEGNLRRLSVITIHLVRRQIQIPSETASLLIKNETALQQSPKGKRSSHPFPTQTCNFSTFLKVGRKRSPAGRTPRRVDYGVSPAQRAIDSFPPEQAVTPRAWAWAGAGSRWRGKGEERKGSKQQ